MIKDEAYYMAMAELIDEIFLNDDKKERNIKIMRENKLLSVGDIRKVSTSYGNYTFNVVIVKKGLNGLYKSESSVYDCLLDGIQKKHKEYINKLKKLKGNPEHKLNKVDCGASQSLNKSIII